MSLLAALALATPIFGFSLTPPNVAPLSPPPSALVGMPVLAQLDEAGEATGGVNAPAEDVATTSEPSTEERPARRTPSADSQLLGQQLRQRQELGTIHRAFGIATWASMLATVVLGVIQYHNMYGWFGSLEDTPCVRGDAVFGQDQCWGTPWVHRVAAIATTALYTTTFALSFVLPDPLGADQGNGALAENLRIHKALRWVHLGGMIAQILLGFAVGQNWFGLDRANDFGAMQAIATVHQVIGLTTFGVLTAAGAIMVF
jgi:hypothetical protein